MRCKDEVKTAAAVGDGPVDAAYVAIREATGLSPKLDNYSIRAVTSGKEALGEATVRIEEDGRKHIYSAVIQAQETRNLLLGKFLESTFEGSAMKLVMQALGDPAPFPPFF